MKNIKIIKEIREIPLPLIWKLKKTNNNKPTQRKSKYSKICPGHIKSKQFIQIEKNYLFKLKRLS